jgi:hypothetical protein
MPASAKGVSGNRAALFWSLFRHTRGVHFGDVRTPLVVRQTRPCLASEVRGLRVSRLLGGSGPSAIRRFVVAVVVDAIQRVSLGWSASHIGKERFKGIAPTVTDRNAAPAVSFVVIMFRVVTAGLHALPDFVFGGGLSHGRLAVLLVRASLAVLPSSAAARLDTSGPQKARPRRSLAPAVASAEPLISDALNNRESSESLSRQIKGFHTMSLTRGAYVALA